MSSPLTPLLFGTRRHDSATRRIPSPSARQSNAASSDRHRSHSLSESLSERAQQALLTASPDEVNDEANSTVERSRSLTTEPAHRRSVSSNAVGSGRQQRAGSRTRNDSPNPRTSPFSPNNTSLKRPSTPRSAQVSRASLSDASTTARPSVVPASDSKLSRRVKLKRSFSEVDSSSIIPLSGGVGESDGIPRRAVSSLVFTSPILQAPPLCFTAHATFPLLPLQQQQLSHSTSSLQSSSPSASSCSLHRIEAGFLHSTTACPERARNQVKKIVEWINSELGGLPPSPIPIRQVSGGAAPHAVPLSPSNASKATSFQPILRATETLYVLVNTDTNSTAGKRREVIAASIVVGIDKAWEMIERRNSCFSQQSQTRNDREEVVGMSSQDFTQPMDDEDQEQESMTTPFKSPVTVVALSSPSAPEFTESARKKLKTKEAAPPPQRSASTSAVSVANATLVSATALFEFSATQRAYHPAAIGVEKILVARRYRRAGWASTLLEALRHDLLMWNSVVPVSHIAFSEPLELGCRFASSYCKTSRFLTY